MPKPVITVENLSKAYRIGLKEEVPDTLMSAMTGFMKAPLKKFHELRRLNTFGHAGGEEDDLYWALKDVSFEVQEGEVLGVIGRNGAGKSTLLKILSRITEPTSGRAVIRGRVSSLLEVGTGFHPELSGRENVYLNGTILGMTKREIDRKFDEIVDFSGVEKFLDTPIKRYSSGMKVRLAFAVAAHLEPEILIIDEVLAVGDAEFQNKCMGKMQDVAKGGRTVLFVSHNMAAVQNLCHTGIVLLNGRREFQGPSKDAVACHLSSKMQDHGGFVRLGTHPMRRKGCLPLLKSVRFLNEAGVQTEAFGIGEPLTIELEIDPVVPLRNPQIGIGVDSSISGRVFSVTTYLSGSQLAEIRDPTSVRCCIESLPLIAGRYFLSLSAGTGKDTLLDAIDEAVHIDVVAGNYFGGGKMPSQGHGVVAVRSTWECVQSC